MKNKQRKAVSSVVATLLILGLTVSVFAIASLTTFSLLPDQTAQPTVKLDIDTDSSEATVVDAGNADELTLSGNPDENISNVTVGKKLDLNNGNQNPNVVATVDGNEVLVEEVDKESLPGTTLSVTYNPPVEGAVVEALAADGTILETATTPSDGEVRFLTEASDIETVRVVADGATINQSTGANVPTRLYAEATKPFDASAGSPTVDFDNSKAAIADVDGTETAVIYETDSSGTRLVSNLAELQAMNGAPDKNYRLVSNIDASPTKSWNGGSGFKPIAFDGTPFDGSFDGAGNQISGLTIDRRNSNNVALFSDATGDSDITNVNLKNIEVRGENDVGAAVASGAPTTANIRFSGLVNAAPDIESDIALSNGKTLLRNTQKFTVTASDVRGDSLDYKIDGNANGEFGDGVDKKVLGKSQNRQVTVTDPYNESTLVENGLTQTPRSTVIDGSGQKSVTKRMHVTVIDEHGQQTTSQVTQELNINTPPTISSGLSFDDTTLVSSNQGFTVTAEDINGDKLDYRLDANDDGDFNDAVDKTKPATPESQQVSFDVNHTSAGSNAVRVKVVDPSDTTASDTLTVELNRAPHIVSAGSDAVSFDQSTLTSRTQELNVKARDSQGEQLTYRIDGNNNGEFNDAVDRTLSGQTAGQQVQFNNLYSVGGDKTIQIEVEDPKGITDTETITADINQRPRISSGSGLSFNDNTLVSDTQTFTVTANDRDGEDLTYKYDVNNDGDFNEIKSGQTEGQPVTFNNPYSTGGDKTLRVVAEDSTGETVSDTVSVTLNKKPALTGSGLSFNDNTLVSNKQRFTVTANDPDGDLLTYKIDANQNGEFVDSVDRITTEPEGTQVAFRDLYSTGGEKTAEVVVEDGRGGTVSDTITVDLNERPTLVSGLSFNNNRLVSNTQTFTVKASDADNDDLTYKLDVNDNGEFNDGVDVTKTRPQGQQVSFTNPYTSGGEKTADLRIEDANDIAVTDTINVDLSEKPVLAGNGLSFNNNRLVSNTQAFTVTADDPDGDNLDYKFDVNNNGDFNDGVDVTKSSRTEGQQITLNNPYTSGGDKILRVQVEDPTGGTDTDTVSVDLNEKPTIDSALSFNDNTLVSNNQVFTVTASDPDGDNLDYRFDVNDNGEFNDGVDVTKSSRTEGQQITLSNPYSSGGSKTLDVEVEDPTGGTVTDTVSITLNEKPALTGSGLSFNDNTLVSNKQRFTVTANDPDGDLLTYKIDANQNGEFVDSVDRITTEPEGTQVAFRDLYSTGGEKTAEVVVEDGRGGTVSDTITVDLNERPTLVSGLSFNNNRLVSNTQTFTANATDADGDDLTYKVDINNNGDYNDGVDITKTRSEGQQVSFTNPYTSGGEKTADLRVEDANDIAVTDTINVDLSEKPVLTGDGLSFNNERLVSDTQAFTVTASDPDGDDLTYRFDVNNNGDFNDGVDVTKSGRTEGQQITLNNPYSSGRSKTLDVEVEDPTGGTATDTLSITLNEKPSLTSGISFNDNTLVSNKQRFTVTADDPDGDLLTYKIDANQNGEFVDSVDRITTEPEGTQVAFRDLYSTGGEKTAEVVVEDGRGGTVSDTITVDLNERPTLVSGLSFNNNRLVSNTQTFTVKASDADNDDLTYKLDVNNNGDYNDGVDITKTRSEGRQVSFTNPYSTGGSKTLDLRVKDGGGGIVTDTTSVELSEEPALTNSGPSSELSFNDNNLVSNTQEFTLTATDPDGGDLTYKLDANNNGEFNDGIDSTKTVPEGQQVSFNPDFTSGGSKTVRVVVEDPTGGTVSDTITIDLSEKPTFDDGQSGPSGGLSFNDNTLVSNTQGFTIAATDPDGGDLTYKLDANNNGEFNDGIDSTKTVPEGQQVSFNPDFSSGGSKTLRIVVEDSAGGTVSDTITIDLNEQPTVTGSGPSSQLSFNDNTLVSNNQIFTVTASDPDGDALTYKLDANNDGEFNDNVDVTKSGRTEGQQVSFRPDFTSGGSKTLRMVVEDSNGATDSDTITVDLNEQPRINSALSFNDNTLVSNNQIFTVTASDPDGDSLRYELDVNNNGDYNDGVDITKTSQTEGQEVTFTNPYSSGGQKTADVRIEDGNGGTASDTITVTLDQNRAPTINSGLSFNNNNLVSETQEFDVTASDPDGDTLTYTFDVNDDGDFNDGVDITRTGQTQGQEVTFIDPYSSGGEKTAEVKVEDGRGGTASNTLTVTLNENQAPTIDSSLSFNNNNLVSETQEFDVTASDPDGDDLTYKFDAGNDGSFEETRTGQVGGQQQTFTHNFSSGGSNDVKVVVEDARGKTTSETTTINLDDPVEVVSIEGQTEFELRGANSEVYTATAEDTDSNDASWSWNYDVAHRADSNCVDAGCDQYVVAGHFSLDPFSDRAEFDTPSTGTHYVTATVETPDGRTDSLTKTIDVNAQPTVSLSGPSSDITTSQTATFSTDASDGDGDSVSLSYSAEGGATRTNTVSTAAGEDVTYSFSQTGTHTITVTASDGDGGTDTATADVTVFQNLAPSVTSSLSFNNNNLVSETQEFDVTASDPNGDDLTYKFDAGNDGSFEETRTGQVGGQQQTFSHNFSSGGSNDVKVVVEDARGKTTSETTTINLDDPVEVVSIEGQTEFELGETSQYDPEVYTATAKDTDSDDASWSWTYNKYRNKITCVDSGCLRWVVAGYFTLDPFEAKAAYNPASITGTYYLTATVETPDGRTDSLTKKIEITYNP